MLLFLCSLIPLWHRHILYDFKIIRGETCLMAQKMANFSKYLKCLEKLSSVFQTYELGQLCQACYLNILCMTFFSVSLIIKSSVTKTLSMIMDLSSSTFSSFSFYFIYFKIILLASNKFTIISTQQAGHFFPYEISLILLLT